MTANFSSSTISNTSMHEGTDCRNELAEYRCSQKRLAEQQILVGLNIFSPPVSPILSLVRAWTEREKRTTEVSIIQVQSPDSSKGSAVSY